MRFVRRHRPTPLPWAVRLVPIGRALDALGPLVNDVAISVTGSEVRVSVLVRRSTLYRSIWAGVDLHLTLASGPLPPPAPGMIPSIWSPRLGALGAALDRVGNVRDPLILAVDGGFAVTAHASTGLMSWEVAQP